MCLRAGPVPPALQAKLDYGCIRRAEYYPDNMVKQQFFRWPLEELQSKAPCSTKSIFAAQKEMPVKQLMGSLIFQSAPSCLFGICRCLIIDFKSFKINSKGQNRLYSHHDIMVSYMLCLSTLDSYFAGPPAMGQLAC